MKLLLDTSIIRHSQIGHYQIRYDPTIKGPLSQGGRILQTYYKPPRGIGEQWLSLEIEALKKLGERLRAGEFQGYIYDEIILELMRGVSKASATSELDLLHGARIQHVKPAIERSRFQQAEDFPMKSRQIEFAKWLISLSKENANRLAKLDRLSEMDQVSLIELDQFKNFCDDLDDTHLPDAFHFWTAARNNLDTYLSIDKKALALFSGRKIGQYHCVVAKPSDVI